MQLQSQLNVVRARHNAEIADLHKQLAENKTVARENENALRGEIDSLKRIISKLEARLGKWIQDSDPEFCFKQNQVSLISNWYTVSQSGEIPPLFKKIKQGSMSSTS